MTINGVMAKSFNKYKELSNQIGQIAEGMKLNSIMKDGKVTLEEAQSIGLNENYDVSTEDGKKAFIEAYKNMKDKKENLIEEQKLNTESNDLPEQNFGV